MVGHLSRKWAERGPGFILRRAAQEIGQWFFHRVRTRLYSLDLTAPFPVVPPRIPAEFALIEHPSAEEMAECQEALRRAGHDRDAAEYFAQGEWCAVQRVKGRIAEYIWVCFHQRQFPGWRIPVEPEECFLRNGFTFPEFRGQRLHQATCSTLAELLYQRGYTAVWSDSDESNRPSIHILESLGYIYRYYLDAAVFFNRLHRVRRRDV
jgi:GNAT superfamily N-acetyltransferase